MKIQRTLLGIVAGSLLALSSASLIVADQVRYMDSSGNIHFVDRVSQVPSQYLLQVVTPTPTMVYDKKTVAELKRRQREQEQARMRKERERELEIRKRREMLERERKQEERDLRRREQSQQVDRVR